jgi:TPR repeat protein
MAFGPRLVPLAVAAALALAAPAARADFGAAEAAVAAGDFARAVAELAPLVARGDAAALNLQGVLASNGWGMARNPAEAGRLFRRAAGLGYTRALHNLGQLYRSGLGVARNDAEAARLWKIAARQGYVPSQSELGFLYYVGAGVPRDMLRAYFWWSLAARRFDHAATQAREDIIYRLTAHQKQVADRLVQGFESDR